MDANKFGAFLAQLRKEQNMTQADLANKLQVTDKAVSRWERGIGLPDVSTLEPLADALNITVLELLRSERLADKNIPPSDASEVVVDTIEIAVNQQKSFLRRVFTICICAACILVIPVVALFVGITDFPFEAFFVFVIPLLILSACEYFLCKKNLTLAALIPVIVGFSGIAFGLYSYVIAVALLAEFLVIKYTN